MKKLSISVMVVFLLTGCNTWRGFGEDVQKVGEKIEKTSSSSSSSKSTSTTKTTPAPTPTAK